MTALTKAQKEEILRLEKVMKEQTDADLIKELMHINWKIDAVVLAMAERNTFDRHIDVLEFARGIYVGKANQMIAMYS